MIDLFRVWPGRRKRLTPATGATDPPMKLRLFGVLITLILTLSATNGMRAPLYAADSNIAASTPFGPALARDSGSFARRQQGTEPVFALPGTLSKAEGQPFATYLIGRDGITYALVGQDAAVEIEIASLRNLGPGVSVKVWGTLYPQGRLTVIPEIVASTVQQSADPVTGQPAFAYAVSIGKSNVRVEPQTNARPVGQMDAGQKCPIDQASADGKWWRVQCGGGLTGWVSGQLVNVVGDPGAVAPVAPAPTPAPTPTPAMQMFINWRTSYFANRDLSGVPVAVIDSPKLSFNWGTGSPHPQIPPDNFSARFERTVDLAPATYRFVARADDGVRVWLNGELIINDWQEGGVRELRADRYVSGPAAIVVEYFEAVGNAEVHFGYAAIQEGDWEANYFNNKDLSGESAWIRIERRDSTYALDRNWGAASPNQDRIGEDFWSARWEGTFFFPPGAYYFIVNSDDGVRVSVDGRRVIDLWVDGYKERSSSAYSLSEGYHDILVEFYEDAGDALVRLWWQRETGIQEQ